MPRGATPTGFGLLHGSADCGRYTFWALRDTLRYCLPNLLVFTLLVGLLCFGFALSLFLTTLLYCSFKGFSLLRRGNLIIYGQILNIGFLPGGFRDSLCEHRGLEQSGQIHPLVATRRSYRRVLEVLGYRGRYFITLCRVSQVFADNGRSGLGPTD